MKKNIFLFIAVCLLCSCAEKSDVASITGKWQRAKTGKLCLYEISAGQLKEMATCMPDSAGKFTFSFTPSTAGFYVLGDDKAAGVMNKYTFYFKPGDALNLEVNDTSYVLKGKNTKENKAIAQWHDYVQPLEAISVYAMAAQKNRLATYVEFFPLLTEKTAKPYEAKKTGNADFDRAFAQLRDYDLLFYAGYFLMVPRTAHPQAEDFCDYYQHIDVGRILSNASILSYPAGQRILHTLFFVEARAKNTPMDSIRSTDYVLSRTKSDTLKGEMALLNTSGLRSYEGLEEFKEHFGQYLITKEQQDRFAQLQEKFSFDPADDASLIGKPAPNFTGKDKHGKTVSLSDFKGKPVYVDVWATWCGPCKKELPSLKEIEKEYQKKGIVFMGISVDEAKNEGVWKQFIEKEQLPGIQLFGGNGFQSEVAKLYGIKAIPRFLMIDKNGNIVSIDAPRPSSKEIRVMFDRMFK